MLEGLDLIAEHLGVEGKGKTILVRGDSDLVIKFLNRTYKPKKR